MGGLRLGPLLRYVDDSCASIWLETDGAATVEVVAGSAREHSARARTFAVHGHHYALVELSGLPAGATLPYTVAVNGTQVWPSEDPEFAGFPPSTIPTLGPDVPLRLAFGSCRVSVAHDAEANAEYGVDALRAYALHLAGLTRDERGSQPDDRWPDLVLFLGDQVYADETSPEMRRFIEERRDPEQAPWWELKDYEEYAHLYRIAWSFPANRWLLSTLPTAMIFDDHDIRDDWNASHTWRSEMADTTWWHDRIVGGLASYWVYQHLGNLAPEVRAADALWRRVAEHRGEEELDLSEALDDHAATADADPTSYRWSFTRSFGTQARLVVVDSRAARVLDPDRRSMLDESELAWLDLELRGDVDHLLIGTSLPFLLSPALHYFEGFDEALAQGAWGRGAARIGEWLRQKVDLEHWAAFEGSFVRVAEMVLQVAEGRRGRAPATVTFLSGDVHHSYVAEAWPDPALSRPISSRIVQAVCSPIRNPLPPAVRRGFQLISRGRARPRGRLLGGRVPASPLHWRVDAGPWYANNLALLDVRGRDLRLWWTSGRVDDDRHDRPALHRVAHVEVPAEDRGRLRRRRVPAGDRRA